MNSRQAKREICHTVAVILESHLHGGAEYIYEENDSLKYLENQDDCKRRERALQELIDELHKRSGFG